MCANDGEIYIADSYNHKVDNSDPVTFELSWLWQAIYLIENTNSVIYLTNISQYQRLLAMQKYGIGLYVDYPCICKKVISRFESSNN